MRARRLHNMRHAAIAVVTAAALSLPAAAASAQGLFEALFGGFRRAPTINASIEPLSTLFGGGAMRNTNTGPSTAYCVRTCDGRYFPIRAHAGTSSAEMCKAFCPAGETRLFAGAGIDNAVASDGSRYADLDNAYAYRERLVANCTCNGRDPFGLATLPAASDPTLRPGDIIVTKDGPMAFTGNRNKTADFTPVDAIRGLSQSTRDRISQVKVMPPNSGVAATGSIDTAARPPTRP